MGRLGSLFICPVRNLVDQKWCFIVLGEPGYNMFDGGGQRGSGGQRKFFENADRVCVGDVDWKAPETETDAFEDFLQTLPDPTWKGDSGNRKQSGGKPGLRRSGRKRTPLKRLNLEHEAHPSSTKVNMHHCPSILCSRWM